ncbi:MAG: transglycosylase domain-containing protein, partial [Rhodobacteraceae bacterium]|nr:transglycosylase domain-containing protein [Paracoccaceae bacterium]
MPAPVLRAGRIFALAAGLFLAALGRDGFDRWVDATALPPLVVATSVEVLARDGSLLRAYTVADGRWRMAVDPAQVDPAFVAALVEYEDRRFRNHSGVDPRALARAVAQAVWNGRVVSGGSTLTMQVARLLEESGTGRVSGKLRQMRVAWALERRLSKDQILALYLHLAPYGGNLEGIRAATIAWFGKEPRRLTPAEIALLVAIPQSPEARRPDRSVARATDARDRVLTRLEGGGLIDADQARPPGGRHQDVGLAGESGQVGGSGMGQRHSGVPALASQQDRQGASHQQRTPHHDHPGPRRGDPVVIEQSEDAGGGRRGG